MSVFDALTPLLQRWRFILVLSLAFALPAAVISLFLPPAFIASTTFTPERPTGASGPGGLAGLAGRFGLSLDAGGAAMSSDFFAAVLQSREILKATVESRFADPAAPTDTSRSLLDLWEIGGDSPDQQLANGVRTLRGRTTVRVQVPTGIVTLGVRDRSPLLAADVANRMVRLLNEFNLQRRQSQSREGRRFTGERLKEAEAELRTAESEHLRFLQSNRRFQESPLLSFEESRLQRVVQLKQEVYATLNREFEEARIAEVRDTPVLTVIDPATPPDKRASPRRRRIVLYAGVLGFLLAVGVLYTQRYMRLMSETGRADYLAFRDSVRNALKISRV